MTLATICHNCKDRPRKYTGKAPCIDGVPTVEHWETGFCPLGKFPENLPDDEEAVAAIKATETRRLKSGGCCGSPAKL